MSIPLIDISGVSCVLSGKTILDSVSVRVDKGEHVAVIGPNGAGKTTLLRCILRIVPIAGGTISLDGETIDDYGQKRLARRIGYVPQAGTRHFPFTVEEFVMMGRYPYLSPFTSPGEEDRDAVGRAMDATGISGFAERRIETLSGGERQMVLVAAALAQGSDILLLDEPSTFLDPGHAERINRIILGINRKMGMTVVSVTHDLNTALMTSHRTVILRSGKVVHDGASGEVIRSGMLEKTFEKEFRYIDDPGTGKRIIIPDLTTL